jgi:fatty-acyl-CoA synthase
VQVVQDARRGLIAQVYAGTHHEKLAHNLGRYSFHVEWMESPI